jgi:hypothetical protein
MRDQETGASYLGNNLVAYFVGVLLRIDAKRSIAGGRDTLLQTASSGSICI